MKSLKKNYFFNLSNRIIQIITPLITAPYIARVIGAEGVGRISYAESVMAAFMIFTQLGISEYGKRETAYHQDDRHLRSVAFWNAYLLKLCFIPIVLLIYILATSSSGNILLTYFALYFLAEAFSTDWFLVGNEEFVFLSVRETVIRLIQIACIFIFVKTEKDFLNYALITLFAHTLNNFSAFCFVFKYVERVSFKELNPFKGLKPSLLLFLPTVASLVYSILDKVMLGFIGGDASQNGYYEQGFNISRVVLSILVSISTVMMPRVAYHFFRKEDKKVNELMQSGYRYLWMIGVPVSCGLACVASNFVPWFFGPGWDLVITILWIFAPLVLVMGLSNMTGAQYLIPTKRENKHTRSVAIGSLVNLILNLLLIKKYGAIGVAFASVCAEVTIMVLNFLNVRKEIDLRAVFSSSFNYLVAAAVMTVCLLISSHYLEPSIFNTVVLVFEGVVVYFAMLLFMNDSLFCTDLNATVDKLSSLRK